MVFFILTLVRPFISLKVTSRRLQPPSKWYEGCLTSALLPLADVSVPEGGSAWEGLGNQTIRLYCFHLAIGAWRWELVTSPLCFVMYMGAEACLSNHMVCASMNPAYDIDKSPTISEFNTCRRIADQFSLAMTVSFRLSPLRCLTGLARSTIVGVFPLPS
jgi:hypothetical protein